MKIDGKLIKEKIDKVYGGSIKLFEQAEGFSGIWRIINTGRCKTCTAYRLCNVLNIPFNRLLDG